MDYFNVEDVEEVIERRVPRVFRDRSTPFEVLSDEEFRRRYRFTRHGFFSILRMMGEEFEHGTRRSCPLTQPQQFAAFLKVLSANNFQLDSGDLAGASQSTISRIMARFSDWFARETGRFVHWHDATSEASMKRRILQRWRLPDIVGAIDGTHVRIQAPSSNEYAYVNRHNYHSLNVSCIVDDKCRFLWFSAKWPGSTHDSYAFRQSDIH